MIPVVGPILATPPMSDSPRVLVVGADEPDRARFQKTLGAFVLEFAADDIDAVAKLAAGSFDLILLDGDGSLATIREQSQLDAAVVVVTDGAGVSHSADLVRQGATAVATRDDVDSPRLAAFMQVALERRRLDRLRESAETEARSHNADMEASLRQFHESLSHLVQNEKMASLGQLVAGVAHEINNPLAFVSNNLAVLERDVRHIATLIGLYRAHLTDNLPREIVDFETAIDLPYTLTNFDRLLRSSKQGLTRVREIVSNLRDFSRLDEAEIKDVDPNEIIRDTVGIMRYSLLEKHVDLELDLADLPPLSCNPRKLNQVVLSILLNAVQAVDTGGSIAVRSRLVNDGEEIRFEIADNGAGIPDDVLGRIFDPFFTTKPQGVGTGLGLWVSYNIVKEHSGRIEVETEIGKGTTFAIILPLSYPH